MKNNTPDWMMFLRESDGIHFLWNGEHALKITPFIDAKWHHNFGAIPDGEIRQLNDILVSRAYVFTIKGQGKFRVIKRGLFME